MNNIKILNKEHKFNIKCHYNSLGLNLKDLLEDMYLMFIKDLKNQ